MRTFLILLYKELRGIFVSPMAYMIIALVMVVNGVSFQFAVSLLDGNVSQVSLLYLTYNSPWFWPVYFLLFPIITMRLFAEEMKLGTWETLMTAPVGIWPVILAKYVATLIFYCAIWAPSIVNIIVFESIADSNSASGAYDAGSFIGAYLMLFLIGMFNIALGCFASALTKNQIFAAVLAFFFVLAHYLMGRLHEVAPPQVIANHPEMLEAIYYFSTFEHLKTFASGLLDSRPVIYYLTFTSLLLTFTYYVLEHRRWLP